MGHCKDCKYWEHHKDGYSKEWSTCGEPDWVDYADVIPDDSMAIYADASDDQGLECGLKTGPLFGCIKFKTKKAV
jgi:hypothetical protein